jgi:hypothetical protein
VCLVQAVAQVLDASSCPIQLAGRRGSTSCRHVHSKDIAAATTPLVERVARLNEEWQGQAKTARSGQQAGAKSQAVACSGVGEIREAKAVDSPALPVNGDLDLHRARAKRLEVGRAAAQRAGIQNLRVDDSGRTPHVLAGEPNLRAARTKAQAGDQDLRFTKDGPIGWGDACRAWEAVASGKGALVWVVKQVGQV